MKRRIGQIKSWLGQARERVLELVRRRRQFRFRSVDRRIPPAAAAIIAALIAAFLSTRTHGETLPQDLKDVQSREVSEYLDQQVRRLKNNVTTQAMTIGSPGITFADGTTLTSAGRNCSRNVYTSGSGTYTKPAGVTQLIVDMVGGGGGGGAAETNAGSSGGNTIFGSTTAYGGGGGGASGGSRGADGTYASGVTSSTSVIRVAGCTGSVSMYGSPVFNNVAGVSAPANTGMGGAPGNFWSGSRGGFHGGGGECVSVIIDNPADGSTFSYSVGGGGTGGAAGTAAGGNGGSGKITIGECYAPTGSTGNSSGSSPTGAAGGDLTGNYPSPAVAAGAIQTAKLAMDAVDTTKLKTDAVTSSKILTSAINTDKLAADAVTNAKIINLAVDTGKIASGSIDTTKLKLDAVTTNFIADGAVQTGKIGSGAVDTTKLKADAVVALMITDGAVQTSKLGSGSVDTTKLKTDAVTSGAILSGAITTPKFASAAAPTITSMTLTATGSSVFSLTTSSGIKMADGGLCFKDGTCQYTKASGSGGGITLATASPSALDQAAQFSVSTAVFSNADFALTSSPTANAALIQLKGIASNPPTLTTYLSGSGTFTPQSTTKWMDVWACGGGGGGQGGGTGSPGTGTDGGNTTFGSLTANGGGSGGGTSGSGGSASGGDLNITGGWGQFGLTAAGTGCTGGVGGYSSLGIGGVSRGNNAPGYAGQGYGAGGAGGGAAVTTCGFGGGGGGCTHKIFSSLSASYSYSVGAAGSGGAAGTSGQVASGGTAGVIIVQEYAGPSGYSSPASTITEYGDMTFTNTSFATFAGSTITLTMNGGKALVGFSCPVENNTTNATVAIQLLLNDQIAPRQSPNGWSVFYADTANNTQPMTPLWYSTGTYSGSVAFSLRRAVSGGTGRFNGNYGCQFWAQEIRTTPGTGDVCTNCNNTLTGAFKLSTSGTDLNSAWSTWTPSFTGFSANPTCTGRYQRFGTLVIANLDCSAGSGTSNATGFTVTLPVASKRTLISPCSSVSGGTDNGSNVNVRVDLTAASATATLYPNVAGSWTGSGSKNANFTCVYEAN